MASASLLTRAVAGLRLIRSQSSRPAAYSTCGALFKRPCSRAPALSPLVRSRFRFVRNAVTASSSGTMESSVVQQATSGEPVVSADWLQVNLREPDLKVLKNIDDKMYQHIDARSKARFDGATPEPRKGIRSGHVPGSKCIPFAQMLDEFQTLLPQSELQKKFEDEGTRGNGR